ncbi:hypothetical protein AVEN_159786-1 [Araneus ventricosus]|uniref:Uncharacterized protein n=1 Tax=Araneus ventricosus TaxID=182803 RepID=A0A4Y2DBG3_ARAVE|nr:hypothetical protein AVEN_159786-1 [Araneus ventricosus]
MYGFFSLLPQTTFHFTLSYFWYSHRYHAYLARSFQVFLSDGRCNSSSVEAGLLMVINGHVPTPPVGGTHYHRQWASQSHFYTHQGSETPLTYLAASNPSTRGISKWDHTLGINV